MAECSSYFYVAAGHSGALKECRDPNPNPNPNPNPSPSPSHSPNMNPNPKPNSELKECRVDEGRCKACSTSLTITPAPPL